MAKARELTSEFRKKYITKIGGKEAVLYTGLRALAEEHPDYGHVRAYITQYPSKDNEWTAFARAEIYNKQGQIVGMEEADASAKNCGKMTAASFPRMACTRAKGRAFRDFLNIDMVCSDEIPVFEPDKADSKSIGRIKKLGEQLGYDKKKLLALMEDKMGTDSFNDLLQEEADKFIGILEKRIAKKADKKSAPAEEPAVS